MEEYVQVVAFRLGAEEYGVPITKIQEIIKMMSITRVPRAGKNVEGVINLRGNIIPVFNLHRRFNIEPQGKEEDRRIIVFRVDDVKAAIIVDGVSEVLRIKRDNIEDAHKIYGSFDSEFISGVGKVGDRLLILLNLEMLLDIS